jgi:hypothetical protein
MCLTEIDDDHAALRLVVAHSGLTRPRHLGQRELDDRRLAAPLLFLTSSDLVDDERRQHVLSSLPVGALLVGYLWVVRIPSGDDGFTLTV